MSIVALAVIKILLFFTLAFVLAMVATPAWTHVLYKYKLGKTIRQSPLTPVFTSLHQHKSGTPTMGGVLIWGSVVVLALVCLYGSWLVPQWVPPQLNFLTRSETLLPLGVLLASALLGLVDDWFNIKGFGPHGGGIALWHRLVLFSAIAGFAAYWFFVKLDWSIVAIPFYGTVDIGWWAIPLFFIVIVATSFSVNETDGLDGLAGGVLLAAFGAYAAISFFQGRFDLATLCAAIGGALLAFLWFNIHPARFYMGDTGAMPLGVLLAVVAIFTNTVWLLPIIGLVLVVESLSVIIQVGSKKLRHGKKLFRSTPIHHHFEAIGWEEPKIVMRFWIVAAVAGVFGLVLFFIERAIVAG